MIDVDTRRRLRPRPRADPVTTEPVTAARLNLVNAALQLYSRAGAGGPSVIKFGGARGPARRRRWYDVQLRSYAITYFRRQAVAGSLALVSHPPYTIRRAATYGSTDS